LASHLLDTHVVVWLGFAERLGARALAAIADVQSKGGLAISAITSWEIAQLLERGRLQLNTDAHEWVAAVAAHLDAEPIPIDFEIAARSIALPGTLHRDPADRILVATARMHRLTLATRDRALLDYAGQGHLDALAL